ncbi:MAG: hypothetical protein QOH78_461, partial [Verrucomicrobiota bacterium]
MALQAADGAKQHTLSRRDNADRSLARSAWESATPKSRPAGYGDFNRFNLQPWVRLYLW